MKTKEETDVYSYFDDEERLIEEELELPAIPDWPSILQPKADV
jgi:hypothetical protein